MAQRLRSRMYVLFLVNQPREAKLCNRLIMVQLQNAYETIKDAEKRRLYDMRWPSIKERLRAQHESEKHKAEAEEREQRRASQQRAKEKVVEEVRQKRVRHLEVLKRRYNDDIFEVARAVRILTVDLRRLQDKDDQDLREQRERNGWMAYLTSPIYGKQRETDDEKLARETERIQRLASKRIKESELKEKEAKLNRLQDALRDANEKIAVENEKAEEALKSQVREETLRKAQEARMKAEREMREKWERSEEIRVKAQKERAEREAKTRREAEAARKAQEEKERVRKAAAAERDKVEAKKQAQRRQEEQERMRKALAERNQKLAEERRRATHAAEEAARNARAQYGSFHAPNYTPSNCKHERYWPKVEGSQQCHNCNLIQNRFAYHCPGCRMVACANCRQVLRGEVRKGNS